MGTDFYDAAIRHYIDGTILQGEECYDNALYLYGNSVECALKALLGCYLGENREDILKRKYGHKGGELFQDLYIFLVYDQSVLLDPVLGLKLQGFMLPTVLFQNHPERRYARTGQFQQADVEAGRETGQFLLQEMIRQHVDGYI